MSEGASFEPLLSTDVALVMEEAPDLHCGRVPGPIKL